MGIFSTSDVVLRTRWYIRMRWYLLAAIILSGLIPLYIGEGWSHQVQRDAFLGMLAIASNGVFYILGRLRFDDRYYRALAIALLIVDILLVTYFIFTKGGTESRSPILYTVPILMSAAIFGRKAVYVTAVVASISYGGLVIIDYLDIVNSLGTLTNVSDDFPYVLNTVIFFAAIFFIIAFLADFITKLLISKEHQALKTAEALKRAQSIAKLGSWEWDIKSDTITWSEELYKIFDTKIPPTVNYETYLEQLHPDDREMANMNVQRAFKTGKPFSFDHRVVRRNNHVHIIHSEGQVITDRRGRPIKMLGTAQDITSEHALEEAKADFVSLASHQLRTPATGVKMTLGLLMDGYAGKLTAKQRKLLNQAYETNERQLRIANDLLNVARIESGKMNLRKNDVDIKQWLERIVADQLPLVKKRRQKIELQLPPKPVYIMADADRLQMAVDNLINNASKYSPADSTITITLTDTKRAVRIAVKDEGIGIAKSDAERLFKKFSRLDNRLDSEVEGSGLGLYLAQSIAKLHDGHIKLQSMPGNGSVFVLYLPKEQIKDKVLKKISAVRKLG